MATEEKLEERKTTAEEGGRQARAGRHRSAPEYTRNTSPQHLHATTRPPVTVTRSVSHPTSHSTPTPPICFMQYTLNISPARLLLSIATHTTHATPVPAHLHALAPALAAPPPKLVPVAQQ